MPRQLLTVAWRIVRYTLPGGKRIMSTLPAASSTSERTYAP
jgi:hypothetical protein